MITLAIALLVATAGPAAAGPAPSPAAGVAASTSSVIATSTQTVATIYTGDRVRDPFLPAAMGATSARRADKDENSGPETVDIHGMALKGILKDKIADFALFSSEQGGTYMLKAGKLFNDRNKPVPGVTGRIKIKQKTVELITADKDVQVFRLGEEEEKDKTKEKP